MNVRQGGECRERIYCTSILQCVCTVYAERHRWKKNNQERLPCYLNTKREFLDLKDSTVGGGGEGGRGASLEI